MSSLVEENQQHGEGEGSLQEFRPTAVTLLQHPSFSSKYTATKQIGCGGQAVVFAARPVINNPGEENDGSSSKRQHRVAVKVFLMKSASQNQNHSAINEVRAYQHIPRHPLIIRYLGHFELPHGLILVSAYAGEGDIAAQIKLRHQHKQPYTEREIKILLAQLCLAVHHLHSINIVHCDIKPGNLLLTHLGFVQLSDFGLARLLSESCPKLKGISGTPFYLAPEMCNNQSYDSKVDVWSMGVTLYEMMALKRPFVGRNRQEVQQAIVSGEVPEMIYHYSDALRELVRCMMTRCPEERPSVKKILHFPIMVDALQIFQQAVTRMSSVDVDIKNELAAVMAPFIPLATATDGTEHQQR